MSMFAAGGARRAARVVLPCFLAAAPLLGCAASHDAPPPDMRMEALFDPSIHRCSRLSPEILIRDIPAGTDHFTVRLLELGETERLLGGGDWPNDGSGIIPEGALNRYQGPCPPTNGERRYLYVVHAMRRGSPQPLAVRVFSVTVD